MNKRTQKPASKHHSEVAAEATFPMRINRYLSLKNYATRRGADGLIERGLVKINGKTAVLGDKVHETDVVEVHPNVQRQASDRLYYAYNKPVGIVTNLPQNGEQSIEDITHFPRRVFPIGRLDKDSHGLIILTDDGRITDRLLNPKYIHEKEYIVDVHKPLNSTFVERMGRGVKLDDGYVTQECEVEELGPKKFRIVLSEGKKRQIRRMCLALGYEVIHLKRIRIMNITLGDTREGEYHTIKGKELSAFLDALGM